MAKSKNILKYFLGFLIVLIFFEIFFSCSELILPSKQLNKFKLKPGARIFDAREGLYLGKINKFGYLGPEYPKQKSEENLRIALVGDSFVEGFQVLEKFHFRSLIEQRLSKKIGKKVEVLNFGRSGFDFLSMYAYYKNFVSQFAPDITLFFVAQDDFVENSNEWVYYDTIRSELVVDTSELYFEDQNLIKEKLKGRFSTPPLASNCLVMIEKKQTADILFGNYNFVTNNKFTASNIEKLEDVDTITHLVNHALNDLITSEKQVKRNSIYFVTFKELPELLAYKEQEFPGMILDISNELIHIEKSGKKLNYWKAKNIVGHYNHEGHDIISNLILKKLTEFL